MSKGLSRSLGRGNPLIAKIMKQTFVAKDLVLDMDGASGVGFATVVLGDFPEGNILLLGAVSYLSVRASGSEAGLLAAWEGDVGVGTTPMSDATISAGDEDIIASHSHIAVAEIGPRTRGTSLAADTGEIHDNTDGSLEINVNVLIDDDDISADDIEMFVDGEVTISFVMMGDD